MSSNAVFATLSWLGLAVHIVVGIATWRTPSRTAAMSIVNLLIGLGILSYWAQRWYAYVVHHVIWYATDQLVPLYGLAICALAALTLVGRVSSHVPAWIVFSVNGALFAVAAWYVSVMRFPRMI